MSYQRFQLAEQDVRDCKDALDNEMPDAKHDPEEHAAMLKFIKHCVQVAEDHGAEVNMDVSVEEY